MRAKSPACNASCLAKAEGERSWFVVSFSAFSGQPTSECFSALRLLLPVAASATSGGGSHGSGPAFFFRTFSEREAFEKPSASAKTPSSSRQSKHPPSEKEKAEELSRLLKELSQTEVIRSGVEVLAAAPSGVQSREFALMVQAVARDGDPEGIAALADLFFHGSPAGEWTRLFADTKRGGRNGGGFLSCRLRRAECLALRARRLSVQPAFPRILSAQPLSGGRLQSWETQTPLCPSRICCSRAKLAEGRSRRRRERRLLLPRQRVLFLPPLHRRHRRQAAEFLSEVKAQVGVGVSWEVSEVCLASPSLRTRETPRRRRCTLQPPI